MATIHPGRWCAIVWGGLAAGIGDTVLALVLYRVPYMVLPLSAVTRLGPFEPAAMIGHALLVGLPIALFART